MKQSKILLYALAGLLAFTSCDDDDDNNGDEVFIESGTEITLRNFLTDPGEPRVSYPGLFMLADDASFDENATFSGTDVEFPTALAQEGAPSPNGPIDVTGLYKIDLTDTGIAFTVLPDPTNPADFFWSSVAKVFGVLPEGKTDEYVFTLSKDHNISGGTSSHDSVKLEVADKEITVKIGAGFEVKNGASFKIDFK